MTSFPVPVSIDLTAALISYLEPLMAGVVGTTVPNPRPDRFVVLSVAPRDRESLVLDESLVTCEVYGVRDIETEERARILQALILNWEGTQEGATIIYRAHASGPKWLPDPDTDLPRYVVTATITYRASLYLSTAAPSTPVSIEPVDTDYAALITN